MAKRRHHKVEGGKAHVKRARAKGGRKGRHSKKVMLKA